MRQPQTSSTHGARLGLRAAGVRALALLALVVHGAAVGHELLERHEVCAEHGELIHAGVAGHASPAQPARSAEHGAAVWGASDAEHHGHEHCGLACTRQKAAVPVPSSVVLAAAPLEATLAAPAYVTAADLREQHRLAPKQSPPV